MRKRPPHRLTADEIGSLIGLGAVVLGAGLYLYPPALAGFPINDGGLFYTMIRAVQQNSYRLPDYVSYNGLQIPFAYPPFGLLTGAALSGLLHLDPLVILQWLPATILIGISVAFYFLAARMMGSRIEAGIATFLYVCTPRSMTWLVMGGGLTRSLGQLFLILTALNFYAALTERGRRFLILTILFGSLAVVTHPEAALHTAAVCTLMWAFRGRNRQGTLTAAIVALGVAGVSAVWWLPELARFGIAPFASAAQTGLHGSDFLAFPFFLTFTEEPMLAVVAALGLFGVAACLAKRQFLLPVWVLLPFAVEPRAAATVAIIPLACMGAIAVHELILAGIAALRDTPELQEVTSYFSSRAALSFAAYLGLFLLVMATYAALQLSQLRLASPDRAAMQWVITHTSPDSRFLVLTGHGQLFCDPVQEWFPALTQAQSETTIQGYEWSSDGGFFSHVAELQHLQACVTSDSPLTCVQDAANAMGASYDYIYLSQAVATNQFCRPAAQDRRGSALATQLENDGRYRKVYDAGEVLIFAAVR